jgi:hypothetical protein
MAADFDTLRLGEDSEPIDVGSSNEILQASVALLGQTRRTLEIVSRHLDPAIYDTREFTDALTQCVLDSRRARIRIIVMDSTPIAGSGHRMIPLAQRLSSYIEIRNPGRQHASYNSAFLLADQTGSIYRTLADRFEGVVNFGDRRAAQGLIDLFEEMWPLAVPDPNIRRLSI